MSQNTAVSLSRRSLLGSASALIAAPALAKAKPLSRAASRLRLDEESGLAADRRHQSFDRDWRFHRGDGEGFSASMLDETAWSTVDLPHDWSVEDLPGSDPGLNGQIRQADTAPLWQPAKGTPRQIGPFSAEMNLNQAPAKSAGGATGFTVGGVGWYRKRFRLPPLAADARVEVVFDGVYMGAEVWLNGTRLGERPNGYVACAYDLTPHLDRGGENVLAVRVANVGRNSRWYSGSGIYRRVTLDVVRAIRLARWGVSVTTPEVSAKSATVEVRSRIEGAADSLLLVTRLRDRAGRVVAETRSIGQGEVRQSLKVTRPDLWSPEQPFLYSAERLLYLGDQLVDHTETPFGVRRVEIDSARGLRINGKPYKLRGGCIHHDNGLLGAAAFDRAEERKVELLKARGFNAVRLSHNPSSSAFLDACDRLGMLVVAEAFDQWREAKNPDDYSVYFDGWWKRDLAAMIDRDRNHPSVILWSIGNEIPEQTRPEGGKTAKMLADAVRALDPTRPVTQAINMTPGPDVTRADGKLDQIATAALDVAGYNYRLRAYEKDHERFPDRVMLGAESYPSDVDRVWRLTDRSPYLIGDFVWAAMDYLGEAAIGRTGLAGNRFGPDEYPWFNAGCGDLDLIGEQRPQSLLRDVVWGLRPLAMSVQRPMPADKRETPFLWGWRDELQSWTWPEAEGASMQVFVYTRGDRVTLELNGQLVGDKVLTEKDGSVAQIAVPYAPGRLVATAYQAGRTIGRQALETVGSAAALRLRVDRPRLRPDRNDLSYVTVEVVDAQGRLVPDAVRVLRASIWGGAELAAFGNANPRGVASFRQPVAKTWHGRALIVLRPTGADASATLTVAADGLKSASAALTIAG